MWASERISPTARDDFAQFFILFCAILRAPSSLWESPPSSIKRTTRSGESSKQPNRDRKKGLALKRVNPKRGQPGKKSTNGTRRPSKFKCGPSSTAKASNCRFWTAEPCQKNSHQKAPHFENWWIRESRTDGQPPFNWSTNLHSLPFEKIRPTNQPISSQGLGFDHRWTIWMCKRYQRATMLILQLAIRPIKFVLCRKIRKTIKIEKVTYTYTFQVIQYYLCDPKRAGPKWIHLISDDLMTTITWSKPWQINRAKNMLS